MASTIPVEPLKDALDRLDDELILELYAQFGIRYEGQVHQLSEEENACIECGLLDFKEGFLLKRK